MAPDSNASLFNRSMFERLIDCGIKPYFLDIQYRMAPLIRAFPSRTFYSDLLRDAPSISARPMPPSLQPFKGRNLFFLDVSAARE
jgi:senataxin